MNSSALRIIAVVMALVALVLGYFAFKLSADMQATEAPTAPARTAAEEAAQAPRFQAVIALQPLEAHKPIPKEAVSAEPVTVMPEGGFTRVEEVLDMVPTEPIAVGEPLRARHFHPGGAMAQNIRPGERALGVMVNDVIGVGGFARPGDYVDVLLFLQEDTEQGIKDTQARVLLERLRLLAYGTDMAVGTAGQKPDKGAHTAVLAVPEAEVTKLMLGASTGVLRLALHGAAQAPDGEAALPGAAGGIRQVAFTPDAPVKPRTEAASKSSVITLREIGGGPQQAARGPRSQRAGQPEAVIYRGSEKSEVGR